MNKFLCLIVICFCFSCKGEQTTTVIADAVIAKNGVEIPVYNFETFENLLHIDDGKTRIVNFWATWCKPCIVELPYFEMINSAYQKRGVEVLLVSLDIPDHIETKLIPFLKGQQIKSKVMVLDDPDANSWIPKINSRWSGSIPATIIYKGNSARFYEQSFTYNELEKELKKIL